MGHMNEYVWVPVLALLGAILILRGSWAKTLADQFNEAIDRFRGGGPPTPMHPSPANDSALLRRPCKKPAKTGHRY